MNDHLPLTTKQTIQLRDAAEGAGGVAQFCQSHGIKAEWLVAALLGSPLPPQARSAILDATGLARLAPRVLAARRAEHLCGDAPLSCVKAEEAEADPAYYRRILHTEHAEVPGVTTLRRLGPVNDALRSGAQIVYDYATVDEGSVRLVDDYDGRTPCSYWLVQGGVPVARVAARIAYQATRVGAVSGDLVQTGASGAGRTWLLRNPPPNDD